MSLGRIGGNLVYVVAIPYQSLVRRNLVIALSGQKSTEQLDELTKKHFVTLGANIMAGVRTSLMDNDEIEQWVNYEGVEAFQKAIDSGQGIIGALTHTGNWEMYARINPLREKVPFGTVHQPLSNPYIDGHIKRRRSSLGITLFENCGGFRASTKFIKNGGTLGVLIDQYPGIRGAFTPLFGRMALTTPSPALLSLRTGAPVMFVSMSSNGDKGWTIRFHDPIFPPSNLKDKKRWIQQISTDLNNKLVESLEAHPEQWFWGHDRFKTSGRDVFPQQRGLAMSEQDEAIRPNYLIVRSPNPLGDACMSIPAVRAIKAGRPDAHVTILCRSNLEPLWREQGEVDDIIAIPGKLRPHQVGKLIRERRPYYDTAIIFPNSTSSVLEMRAGGVAMRYGYEGHHRKRLLRWVVPEPPSEPPTHHLERYLYIAERLGADVRDRELVLSLPKAPTPIVKGQKQWKIGLCPGAEFGEAKRWPLERYAEAMESLRSKLPDHQIEVIIVGSPAEAELGEALANQLAEPRENLAGKTTIAELVEHLQSCHLVVSNDTGTMHLAAALGIPTVAIFGSTEPVLTSPIGDIHRVIREEVDCSPCFKRTCPIDFRCMTRIQSEQVVQEVEVIINEARTSQPLEK